MVVLVVVPGEERAADLAGVLERAEAVGEVGAVLEGLELRLRERVVVGDVGPRVGLARRPRSASSSATVLQVMAAPRSAWRVSWPGSMPCLRQVSRDQPLGEAGVLALGDHPADHVAAEDVEDHVEVEVGPLGRAHELGDVPGPDLVGPRWPGARAWRSADGAAGRAARGPRRCWPGCGTSCAASRGRALVEQRGVDLDRAAVDEALGVQHVEHRLPFTRRPGARAGVGRGRLGFCRAAGASGRPWPEGRPAHDTPAPCRPREPPRRSPPSVVLVESRGCSGGSPGSRQLFFGPR